MFHAKTLRRKSFSDYNYLPLFFATLREIKELDVLKLTINGEVCKVAAATVWGLLEELGLHPQGTVVERNREIVDREAFRDTHLADGDVLELVRLVGGG